MPEFPTDGQAASRLPSIKSLDKGGLRTLMERLGQPAYRARQVAAWLYGTAPAVPLTSFEQMTDLPRSLRERLAATCTLDAPQILRRQDSRDGSRKYLVQLAGGNAVETVAIPAGHDRLTVCFSTQAGCALGCVFCATGQAGLVRSLGAGEMVDQLRVASEDFGLRVTNAVAMGQGEPFANYNAVLGALRLLNDERLGGIGARRLTVSTCGLLDGIRRFAEEPEQFTLAVSLHSAVQATRDRLMPGLASQPLTELREELAYYAASSGRRPSLEYLLIDGVNDTPEELEALIGFARGQGALNYHVNLIVLNKTAGGRLEPSPPERLQAFANSLLQARVNATIRASRGADIQAACGQLAEVV
ncbi:MAG: 23S rRNA (adenine(2503)-C(2))-methyltransferase RlmN [Coriobacteriales bacterium]|jgi:23S rRNA (adenine2503-C2)-methyltransferase|nr:23S rRNA (adenine(2503)-C(2))-methyltransferase RlmN [Coriobacteriales bacterium]